MPFIQSINEFISIILLSIKQIGRKKVWGVLSLILCVHLLLLLMHYKFYSPFFFSTISFWTQVSPDYAKGFTHYPGHFILLPFYFEWSKLLIGIFFEGWIFGMAAVTFYKISKQGAIIDKSRKFMLYLNLSGAWILINGLFLLVNFYFPSFVENFITRSSRVLLAVDFIVLPFIYVFLLSMFYFTLPVIAVYRQNLFKAIWFSMKMFFARPIFLFSISSVVMAVPILISFTLRNPYKIAEKFNPELIIWIVGAALIAEFIANFFWIATSMNILIDKE